MELEDGAAGVKPSVTAVFKLGDETHAVRANNGVALSEQLVSFKEESMAVLKEFITKHNAPADVPDEPLEGASDEDEGDDEKPVKPPVKKRK